MTAWVVTDLGFGDAGKGSVVDFLVRDRGARLVLRAQGGHQAAHTVCTDDGRWHTFSQVGAGSFVPGVATHLGRDVVVDPLGLAAEVAALHAKAVPDVWARWSCDPACRVATPWHVHVGRARELSRGAARHGSCGVGFGEVVGLDIAEPALTVRAADLQDRVALRDKLIAVRAWAAAVAQPVALAPLPADAAWLDRVVDAYLDVGRRMRLVHDEDVRSASLDVVVEGAQGVLLDEVWGFAPHNTWSDTTGGAAFALLDRLGAASRVHLGLLRTYCTRHGPGPMPSEDPTWDLAEPHNPAGPWQGAMRLGPLDLVLARYALQVALPVDGLVLTHLDATLPAPEAVTAYLDGQERVSRLDPGPAADLAARARLGAWLGTVKVVREGVAPREAVASLGPALWLASSGSTSSAKVWLGPVAGAAR